MVLSPDDHPNNDDELREWLADALVPEDKPGQDASNLVSSHSLATPDGEPQLSEKQIERILKGTQDMLANSTSYSVPKSSVFATQSPITHNLRLQSHIWMVSAIVVMAAIFAVIIALPPSDAPKTFLVEEGLETKATDKPTNNVDRQHGNLEGILTVQIGSELRTENDPRFFRLPCGSTLYLNSNSQAETHRIA